VHCYIATSILRYRCIVSLLVVPGMHQLFGSTQHPGHEEQCKQPALLKYVMVEFTPLLKFQHCFGREVVFIIFYLCEFSFMYHE